MTMLTRQLCTLRGFSSSNSLQRFQVCSDFPKQPKLGDGSGWRCCAGISPLARQPHGRSSLHICSTAAAAPAGPLPGDHGRRRADSASPGIPGPGLGLGGVVPDRTAAAERHKDELHTLNVAIVVNVLIFGAKLWAHVMSGSSSMLAEAMHSVADVLNQMLLRIGLLKAQKGPTEMHPYGYSRDRFVWSLISAVGIFFLGAGASFIHGLHTLMEHRELEHMAYSYWVLLISGLLEGYSLWVASRVVVAGAASRRMGVLQYIRSGMDPTTVAVMMEDGGAVLGLVVAGACTALAQATGNAMWDAAGSILVGCLLGAIATFLVQKNRQLLIGRSMAPADVAAVQSLISADPVVAYVTDTKTEEIGPAMYRFKAEVAWDGEQLAKRYLDRCGRDRLITLLQAACQRGDRDDVERLIRCYGRDLISAVGAEVDRIEADIQRMNPGILYVDLETDRGRNDPWRRGAAALGIAGGEPSVLGSMEEEYTCTLPDAALGLELEQGRLGQAQIWGQENGEAQSQGQRREEEGGPWDSHLADSATAGAGPGRESAEGLGGREGSQAQASGRAVSYSASSSNSGGGGRGLELDLNRERWGGDDGMDAAAGPSGGEGCREGGGGDVRRDSSAVLHPSAVAAAAAVVGNGALPSGSRSSAAWSASSSGVGSTSSPSTSSPSSRVAAQPTQPP